MLRFRATSEHAVEARCGLLSGEPVDYQVYTSYRVSDKLFDILFDAKG